MARFGGNEFSSFSVPLVFDGRYFVLEPGNPALLSVFIEREGKAICRESSRPRDSFAHFQEGVA